MTYLAEWAAVWGVPPCAVDDLRARMGMLGRQATPHPKRPGESASESRVQSLVRLEAAQKGVYLYSNNVGALLDKRGVPTGKMIPESELPLELPPLEDFTPTDKEPALEKALSWKVRNLRISRSGANAVVTGNGLPPQQVVIRMLRLPGFAWRRLLDGVAGKTLVKSDLQSGAEPSWLGTAAREALFPSDPRTFAGHCNAPPSTAGRAKRKMAPPSALASVCSRSPCASIIDRLMDRPMPMPFALVE